jgi:two-component system sensor histidine kinase KdpD
MRAAPYAVAVLGVAAVTALLAPINDRVSSTTVALALLLVVLFVAAWRGMGPALAASAAGMLAFNFFFLPPLRTFTVADPQNWVALAAFLVTAVTAGQLSVRARRRAEEAERGRLEIERLYTELRDAFDRASRAEALRQAEQLKVTLLDAVTHDLRTPLTSIKASVTTLLEDDAPLEDDARRELLEVIDEETDRLNRAIGGLVEIARIEAGAVEFRRRWTAVEEILDEVGARAARIARDRPVDVTPPGELPAIRVDGRAVAEALYLLVENAAKYAPRGTPVRVSAHDTGAGEIRFEVDDEGPGVPPELRDRVFEKFFRGPAAAGAPAASGTGMGLAIARGIVEAHGGRIWIEAGPGGRGARVAFTVPVGEEE